MKSEHRDRAPIDLRHPSPINETRDARIRVLAAVAVRSKGRVLILREEDEPYHKSWVLPEGYPQPGETLSAAAIREVAEELGLDVEIDGLLGVYEDFANASTGTGIHWVIVCFLAHPVPGAVLRPSREAIDFAWIDPSSASALSPPVIRRILDDLARYRSRRGR
jgi:ADP-ribose pyrophosphatase YjhB (NUDIX family)